jgi:tetratricopeptide (TPR) repeat protein
LVWILLGLALFLIAVAVVSGAVFLVLRRSRVETTEWQDPIVAVAPGEIAADLALYPLAGASELETVDAAIANGDLETAYATLVFSQGISDMRRVGRLILLAGRFIDAGRGERAALSYQQIWDVAVLSSRLNDPTQADALLASGRGWAALGQRDKALAAYDQVYLIAVRSPYLQMAQRRHLLNVLEMAYLDLDDTEQAQVCRDQISELDQETVPQSPVEDRSLLELPVDTEPISSSEVGAAEEARRQAAFALLQSLSEGGDPPADLVSALGEALQAEDAVKLSLYQQELEATTQLGRRINLHWHVIDWLMLKYRVAMQALGLSLVPEWEAQVAGIQSSLSKAYEDLFFDYEDLVTGLPDASLVGPGSYKVRRETILAGRLGRYPNHPGQQLAEKLQEAVSNLIAAGYLDELYVDVAEHASGLRFFLSPADHYGISQDEE